VFLGRRSKPQSRIDSLIGAGTRVEGNIQFSGGLRVDGAVRGNVAAVAGDSGTLVVSEHARVEGEVRALHIVVNGTIHGPVYASETLELQASARVRGDVHYRSIEVQQGAVIEGRLVHQGSDTNRASEKPVELKLASLGRGEGQGERP